MGAQSSSSRPSNGFAVNTDHQELLGEYIQHVRAVVDECAAIFRGASSVDDDESGIASVLEQTGDKEREPNGGQEDSLQRQLRQLRLRMGSKPTAYPRRVQLPQFDEIFGMLVADTEQHFRFFQVSSAPPTAVAHHVFCCVALLMRADLRGKMDFILRLYADSAGRLTPESKRMLLLDMTASVTRLTGSSETLSRDSNIIAHLEKTLFSDSPDKLDTVREVFDACFTDAQISGALHEINTSVQEFIDALRQRQKNQAEPLVAKRGPSTNRQQSPKRASFKFLQTYLQSSVLWEMRSGDYPFFWRKEPPRVHLSDATTFALALEELARDDSFVLLSRDPIDAQLTTVTISHFLAYYLHILEKLASDVASGAIQRDQRLQRHSLIERTVREVSDVPLIEVVETLSKNTRRSSFFSRQCIDEELPFFDVVLLLASGKHAVSVLSSLAYQGSRLTNANSDYTSVDVLGSIEDIDVLQWIELDHSLLNNKHLLPLAAFPQLFYAPARVSESSMTLSDAFAEMKSLCLSGITVQDSKLLSVEAFRDTFLATRKRLGGGAEGISSYPLLTSLMRDGIAKSASVMNSALTKYISLPPTATLAQAIRMMVEHQTRRLLIRRASDQKDVGSVRATDVLKILLHEQHISYWKNAIQ